MDIRGLVRDPAYIHTCIKELPNGSIITTKACTIQIPTRFSDRKLAEIGSEIFIPGIYAILIDGHYAVSTINALIKIDPYRILKTDINEDEYFMFNFEPGQVLFGSTNLVKNETLIYYIFDEIITKGNVPWYLNYNDLGCLFDTALKHAGTNIAENQEITELIVSLIGRDKKDRIKYYRSTIKDANYVHTNPPEYVPLNSVIYSATNTLNKMVGSYINEGIVSALVNPTERVERVESLLRA